MRRRISVQLKMQRVEPVLERSKEIRDIRMLDRLTGIVSHKILLRDVSHIIALIILCQQVIKGLILDRTAVLGNRGIPLISVGKFWVHIKTTPRNGCFLCLTTWPR